MLLLTLLLKHTKSSVHVEIRACLCCALTPRAQYIGHHLCEISYSWFLAHISLVLCKMIVYRLQIIVHTCLSICVWLMCCALTPQAQYIGHQCVCTLQSRKQLLTAQHHWQTYNLPTKHNMLHKYLTDPHNFRCPFVHLPRFVATQVLRWYLKVDLVSTMQLAVHFCEYCVI